MTRTAHTVKITRQSAGNYAIIVNGIKRGDIGKRSDGWWNANFCDTDGDYTGAAIAAPTKREIVAACKAGNWW